MPTKIKQSVNRRIPKLRFPGFSGEWEEKRLGRVCDFKQGVQVDLDLQLKNERDGYTKFLRIENYTQRSQDFRFISKNSSKNKEVSVDDIVVVRYGATAGFISRGLAGVLANNLFSIRPQKENEVVTDFLFRILKQEKVFQYLQSAMSGGAMPALSFSIMNPIKINLPSLPEQQKIAEFIGAVDEWTENLRRQKEELEAYKKGMMQKTFAPSCHSRADGNPVSCIRFKDDNGNNFPEWEEKTIGQVLKIGSGKDYKQLGHGNIPVFGTGGYMLSVNKVLYSGESVFIGRKGTINKPFYYNGDFWTVDTLFYTYDFSEIIPKFTYLVFQQINWLKYNEASGVPSLSKATIEKIKINIPSIAEQQKVTEYFTSIDDLINLKRQQITRAEEWKRGLMQRLFV